MPSTLTALFATAIHEARIADGEPVAIERVAAMLVTAAGARRIEWLVDEGRLAVNEYPIRPGAPGADLIVASFGEHLTRRLALPAGLAGRQWIELAGLYASAAGIYPSADHMRAAIAGLVPGAEFEPSTDQHADQPSLREAVHHLPGMTAFTDSGSAGDTNLVSRETGLSRLSERIDPILDAARDAVARADWQQVAEQLLELESVARDSDDATRTIIDRERRRILPPQALARMLGQIPSLGASSMLRQALDSLGTAGAETILELLAEEPSRARQRLYVDVLSEMRHAEPTIIAGLGSRQDAVVRDAASVVGRRRMEAAVPILGTLLRHPNEEIRTAAWRALEDIGTAAAMDLIR
jgi:hypothetical protein